MTSRAALSEPVACRNTSPAATSSAAPRPWRETFATRAACSTGAGTAATGVRSAGAAGRAPIPPRHNERDAARDERERPGDGIRDPEAHPPQRQHGADREEPDAERHLDGAAPRTAQAARRAVAWHRGPGEEVQRHPDPSRERQDERDDPDRQRLDPEPPREAGAHAPEHAPLAVPLEGRRAGRARDGLQSRGTGCLLGLGGCVRAARTALETAGEEDPAHRRAGDRGERREAQVRARRARPAGAAAPITATEIPPTRADHVDPSPATPRSPMQALPVSSRSWSLQSLSFQSLSSQPSPTASWSIVDAAQADVAGHDDAGGAGRRAAVLEAVDVDAAVAVVEDLAARRSRRAGRRRRTQPSGTRISAWPAPISTSTRCSPVSSTLRRSTTQVPGAQLVVRADRARRRRAGRPSRPSSRRRPRPRRRPPCPRRGRAPARGR